jgi:acyl-homoserine lactone acylase PvdQ
VGAIGRILVLLFALTSPFLKNQLAKPPASGLKREVTIYRDRYGVPHIVGETEEATFFGYGYAQAQDHLDRMMRQYRDVQGRLSEVVGESALGRPLLLYHASDYRWDGDYLQRLLRTWQTVQDNRNKINPHTYELLSAFADGVNCYISENRTSIPAWIDRVTPEDIEALERGNYMRYYSIGDALSKLPGKPAPLPRLGSNHWAVAAEKSASGEVMQVGEIHMPWNNRFQMYEAHLMTPGKLNVAGISWFGSPFFLCGFNSSITWSVSYNEPNISDIYEETINATNSLEYLYQGHWRTIRKEAATFRVKTVAGKFKNVTLPLYYTHHGPIVRFDPVHHRAYSAKVPNFDGVNYSTGLYELMIADSISDFRGALAHQLIPRWNFLVTDKQHIYWVHNGVVPRRDPVYNWSKPVPGWTSRTEWKGYLPFSRNPQLLDPPSGFIQNSNNPPWVSTKNSGINPLQPTTYYYSYRAAPPFNEQALNPRGERLLGVLTRAHERFTRDQMVSLAFDTYILAADVVVPLLEKARSRHLEDQETMEAAGLLQLWNRRSGIDSQGFTVLYYWAKAYRQLFGNSFYRFTAYNRSGISVNSEREQERAWSALQLAVSLLKKTFGTSRVAWGKINRVVRNRSFPADGNGVFDVLHPDSGPEQSSGHIQCEDGWGHIMVAVEGDAKQVWTLLPYGESEDPASPHYNDMARLHSEGKLKPFWFTAPEILQNTESVWGDRTRIQRLTF